MRYRKVYLAACLLVLGGALTGCESFNWDPTDWFSTKKPLPGERKEVFPGGVPGVPQGVPADLVKGYQPQAEPAAPPPPQVAEEKPKPKPKPKPVARAKPKPAAAPTQVTAAPQSSPAQAPWPSPQPVRPQDQSAFPPPPPPQR